MKLTDATLADLLGELSIRVHRMAADLETAQSAARKAREAEGAALDEVYNLEVRIRELKEVNDELRAMNERGRRDLK